MTEAEQAMTPRPADKWEERRHADRRIRNVRYGFFKTAHEPTQKNFCAVCGNELVIVSQTMIISGRWMHGDCFVEECRANRKDNR